MSASKKKAKTPSEPPPSPEKAASKPPSPSSSAKHHAPPDDDFDPARGQAAFHALLSRFAAIPASEIANTATDIEAAALAALGVFSRIMKPEVYSRFGSLPSAEFDIASVDGLGEAAWAVMFAHTSAAKARAGATEARLPAKLVSRAIETEARMQACCEYYLADDMELGPEVARLRAGVGHRDLANDLLGYADIYRMRNDHLKLDRKNYRATDAADAIKIAEEMISLLGEGLSPEAKIAAENLGRSWTYLLNIYDEVKSTGRWLFRGEPDVDSLFPSLFSAGRTGRPKKKAKTEPAPT